MERFNNFSEFILDAIKSYGSDPVLLWKKNNNYESLNGEKLIELVYRLSVTLKKYGLNHGDRAAIISENRCEWVAADIACIINGIVTVPVYTSMTADQICFILQHSGAKLCFTSNKLVTSKVLSVLNQLNELRSVITFNKTETGDGKTTYLYDELYSQDNISSYSYEDAINYLHSISGNQKITDLLTIIYTSGTTGHPKGVCLTHGNLLANIRQCNQAFEIYRNDRFLSFLPLAHSYERTAGYYVPLSGGARIYYADSIDSISTQMTEVKPTLMLCVPMLFERIRQRLFSNIETMSPVKKLVTKFALNSAIKYRNNKSHILWRLADKLVLKKIREKTGGCIRFFISGGSALSKELGEFFDSLGLLILQGYGMTEASPVISVNRASHNKFGTTGLPLNGIDVKIAADGEILVRGDNVMRGYYRDEAETKKTIIDGWLHTGDIGEIDSEGFLKITDRKKSLVKSSGGKYISLTYIEETIKKSEYISQVFCYASDNTQFVSALIVPEEEKIKSLAEKANISFSTLSELTEKDFILNFYESEIDVLQRSLAKHERIRKFLLLDKPFTVEDGELTPTLKLRRKVIEVKYRELIESFYKGK